MFYEGSRGDSTHVRELVQNLAGLGHEVILIACNLQRGSDQDNIDIYPIKYYSEKLIPKFFISIYAFVLGVIVLIKRKPDIIYKRQSAMGEDILIAMLARCPVVTEINGLVSEEAGSDKTYIHKIINNIFKYISKQSILHSDHLVAVTTNLKNIIHDEFYIQYDKITVIPNGANVKLFHPSEKKLSWDILKLSEKFKYICFIGNLAPYQGIETLIQAAPLILKKYPDIRFLIVGDGIMKNEWVQISHNVGVYDKFIFTGKVPIVMVSHYINASDVCVSPFRKARNAKIGLSPLKIYEYMACGKPVVCSRIPNLEFIEQQKTGILVEPQNPEELAKAIIDLMDDENLREEMGINARDLAVKNYSWEANARKVEETCENLMNSRVN